MKNPKWKADLKTFLIKSGIIAAAAFITWNYVAAAHINWGTSMYPKICDGDLVIYTIFNKTHIYPEDVLVYETDKGERCARAAALGGDVIEIEDSGIYVNGAQVSEEVMYDTLPQSMRVESPYTVPEGCVFVMNDYRSDSGDSRTFGAVNLADVKGKAFLIVRRRGF